MCPLLDVVAMSLAQSSVMGENVTCIRNECRVGKSTRWLSMSIMWILSILMHEEYIINFGNIMSIC